MSGEPNSLLQKRKFHAMLRDISKQVKFAGDFMDEHEWKLLVYAAAYGQDVCPNPFDPSRFVIRNKKRTRDLDMPTMAELITQLYAFGAENRVEWRDPAWVSMRKQEEREAARMRRAE